MCFKPEDDHKRSLIKGLDVLCQCAALFERRVQSGTRVRKAQAVTRQTNPIGRSMIEMLGVLAIIGVLSVGGIAGYSKAMMQFKINKTKQQIAEVVFNIRSMYAQQNPKDYSSLYVDSLPEDFGKAFGGYAEFNSVPNGILEPERFSISLFGLPMEACVALATTNWGTDETTGFVGMSILSASAGYGYIYIGCKGEGEGSFNAFYYACSGSLPLSPLLSLLNIVQEVHIDLFISVFIKKIKALDLPRLLNWWSGTVSNRRHKDFQSFALPAELPDHRLRNTL